MLKLFFTGRIVIIFQFLFWLFFLLLVYIYNKEPVKVRIDFDIALLKVSGNVNSGAFYVDTGNGFNENETIKFNYYQRVDGTFAPYSFVLASKDIKKLRFDPLPGPGLVSIKNIVITRYEPRHLIFGKETNDVRPLHAIEKIEKNGPELTITANGEDPYILFNNASSSFTLESVEAIVKNVGVDKLIAGIAAWVLLSALLTWYSVSD